MKICEGVPIRTRWPLSSMWNPASWGHRAGLCWHMLFGSNCWIFEREVCQYSNILSPIISWDPTGSFPKAHYQINLNLLTNPNHFFNIISNRLQIISFQKNTHHMQSFPIVYLFIVHSISIKHFNFLLLLALITVHSFPFADTKQ